MGRVHAQRRRRIAVATCVLWLVAVELLPNLHLAFHAEDHSHEPDGTITLRSAAAGSRAARAHAEAHARGVDHDHADHHSELAYEPDDAEPAPAGSASDPAATAIDAHEHAHPPRRRRSSRGPLSIDVPAAGHVAAGIAHRALALHQPAPPPREPAVVVRATWWIVDAPIERTTQAHETRPTARGPPPSV
jgi:hypothetical protein